MKSYVISDFESNRKKKLVCNFLKRQDTEISNPSFEKGKNLFYLINEASEKELLKNSKGIMVIAYNIDKFFKENSQEIDNLAKEFGKGVKYFGFYNHSFIKISEST